MSGYILNREGIREKEKKTLYRPCELELMTTHQLREICRQGADHTGHSQSYGQGRAGTYHYALPRGEGPTVNTHSVRDRNPYAGDDV